MADETPPAGIDPDRPTIARIYDHWLGGKDNFAADRAAAEEMARLLPQVRELARANRRFLVRAVRYLAERGIDQYIDLGAGIPTSPNVHEIARAARPGARVVYVDSDPMVLAHSRALRDDPGVAVLRADVRDPAAVLGHDATRRLIDPRRPAAVLMIAVLHYLGPDDDVPALLRAYRDGTAPGSLLALSSAVHDGVTPVTRTARESVLAGTTTPVHTPSRARVAELLRDVDLVEPGLVPVTDWRAAEPPLAAEVVGCVGHLSPPA